MASQPLVQGPFFGAPVSRLDFTGREFFKTPSPSPSPSPESSPEKEEANRVEVDQAARDKEEGIHGENNLFDFFDVLDMLSEDASRGEDVLSQIPESRTVVAGECKAPTLTISDIFAQSAAKMKKYKTVTRLVRQDDIDRLIGQPPPPVIPSFFFKHEGLDSQLSEALASTAASAQALVDSEKDVLDQYYANGYAYAKFTVFD